MKNPMIRLPTTMTMATRVPHSSMEFPHQRFFVNVYNNSGTVVHGSNNVVNVHPPATRSATLLQRENVVATSNERVAENDFIQIVSFSCTAEQSSVAYSQNSRVSRLSGRSFVKGDKAEMTMSSFFPVVKNEQHYRECKREKRKRCLGEAGEKLRRERRDHKHIKRQRRNSRPSTTSSDEDVKCTTLYELPFESINSSSFQQVLKSFYSLCTDLHPLRDNGRWSEFDDLAQQLLGQAGSDLTSRIFICLEKSVALCYQKKLEESEDLIKDAEKKIAQTSGSVRLLLEMLSNCYRAGLYRRRKVFGQKRERWLLHARKLASGFPPCLAVGILLYEEGSYKRDVATILLGSRKEPVIAEAKGLMKRCIDLCCWLDREQVYVRKQHVAMSKMAIMNLHCETSVSRSTKINLSNIVEAGKFLETLQTDYYSRTEVQGAKIQRLMAKVDLFYRLDKFPEAEKVAREALEIAERLEFNLDVIPLLERLTDIRRKLSAESSSKENFREIPRIIDSCSGSSKNNTPYSSEYEDKL